MITFTIAGQAMSVIEGSELYQRPHLYSSGEETMAAGAALRAAASRKVGRYGRSYTVTCDVAAAEVIADYFETVGSAFAGGEPGETRADGRALFMAAARVRSAMAATVEA